MFKQAVKTFLGSDHQPGNHWTLCHVDANEKRIVYADSLGWAIPDNLLSKLDSYIKAINVDLNVADFIVSTTHNPNSKYPIRGGHKCNHTCTWNYPLQTCSNICGIVVMVMARVACHHKELFQALTRIKSSHQYFCQIHPDLENTLGWSLDVGSQQPPIQVKRNMIVSFLRKQEHLNTTTMD